MKTRTPVQIVLCALAAATLLVGAVKTQAAAIVQSAGASYIAWEAENNVSIANDPSTPTITWDVTPDSTASGGAGLTSQGAADTGTARSTASYTLVFNAPGTYQLYLRYRCNNDLGGQNSYRFPDAFGPTPSLAKVSQANQQGNPTTFTYIAGGEREQNTANQARYVITAGDVGLPKTFVIGTRESGFEIDRFVLSTDLALDETGFNATVNSGTFTLSSQPVSQTALVGGSATFSVTADQGVAPYTYQWYVDDVADPAGTSSSYTVSGLTAGDTGKRYHVVVTDSTAASVTSRKARLNVADANGIVSVSFEGRGDCSPACSTLASTDTAGLIPLGNWNNIDNSGVFNGVTGPLNNANGSATAITLNYDANDSWNNDFVMPATPSGDQKMFKGISKANGANRQNNYSFQNLADGYYDLIVYLNVNGDGRIGDASAGGQSYYFASQHMFNNTFTLSAASSPSEPRAFGNYLKFSAVSPDSSHNLTMSFINRGDPDGIGIGGFQLFPAGVEAISITSQPASISVGAGSPFSFTVGVGGSGPYSVQWYSNGVAIAGANALTYSGNAILNQDGTHYSVSVSNSIPSGAVSQDAVLQVADVPVLVAAGTLDSFTQVCLRFSKPLSAGSLALSHYAINNGVTINSAAFSASDPSVVILQTSTLVSGTTYTVTVTGVQDTDATPHTIFPNPSTKQFTPGGYGPVRITYRQYRNIGGSQAISQLTSSPKYPNNPDYVEYNPALMEYPQTQSKPYGNLEGFGAVISGYYVAPVSGNFQFGVAADDFSELWLSTDANPANKVKIAGFNDWTDERNYVQRSDGAIIPATSRSGLIPLVAGNIYYMEGLYKEGGGGDHIEVAVKPPGGADIVNGTTSIPISQFAPDPGGLFVFGSQVYTPGDVSLTAQPADASVIEGQTVHFVTDVSGTPPYTITWYENGVAIPNSNTKDLAVFATPSNDGHVFHAVVQNLCSSATTRDASLAVTVDTIPPTVADAGCDPVDKKLRVVFSEPVTAASATDIGNYAFVDGSGLTVDAALLMSDNKTVLLTASDVLVPSQLYSLHVQNIVDRSVTGNVIDPVDVPITGCICSNGVVLVEMFRGDSGPNNFQTLTNNPKWPNSPDNLYFLTSPNWPQTPNAFWTVANEENYGLRMRGFLVPSTTGNYSFSVHADDSGFLAVSTDANPANLRTILNAQGDCGACGTPTTAAITLEAGRAYYFESIFQEGGGGDYLELKWKLGNGAYDFIPGANLRYCYDPQHTVLTITGLENQTVEACRSVTFAPTYTISPGQGVITYQWMREGTDIPGATSPTYTIPHADDTYNGALFQVRVNALLREVVSDPVFLTVDPDTDVPTIVKASGDLSRHHAIVTFSEAMDVATASDRSLYTVSGPGGPLTITGATVVDETNVVLTIFEQLAEGETYTVTLSDGIKDLCLAQTALAGDSATFKGWVYVPCTILFQAYDLSQFGGAQAVSVLTGSPLYPNHPRDVVYIHSVDSRQAYPDDSHEMYGGRLTGFVVPPVTGDYVFSFQNDDDFSFRLNNGSGGNSEDPAGAVEVALGPCCSGTFANPSAAITLNAGQRYYFEGLWKEGGGGDYFRVAAALVGGPAATDVIGPEYIGTYVDPAVLPAIAPTLPTGGKLPLGSLSKRGFDVHTVQVGTNIDNLLSIAELLLSGNAGPNLSTLPFSLENDVINYTIDGAVYGSIPGEKPVPGIPGTTASTDNIAMEATAYVELQAGFHCMIVNSDDGFRVTPALCAADPNNSIVLGQFEGGRGASDTPFVFYVPEAGLYPMRLVWEQGGGGANVEWVDIRPGGAPSRFAVNGDANIKAFSASQFIAVRNGNNLDITWNSTASCPFRLQMTDELKTPSSATIWTDVAGAGSASIPIAPTGNAFFRLIRP